MQPDFTVPGFTNVMPWETFETLPGKTKPLPQLACGRPVWQVVLRISCLTLWTPREAFDYFDEGIMAMIGRNWLCRSRGASSRTSGAVAFAAWLGHAACCYHPRQGRSVCGMGLNILAGAADAILDLTKQEDID